MEDEDQSDGYHIANARIPILLNLRKIKELKPHEQTIQEDLDRLIATLRRDPVLRHPIITDQRTGSVLDGTHRLAALKALNCDYVPCAEVDYENPSIVVDRWFREVKGMTLDDFLKRLDSKTISKASPMEAEDCLRLRKCYASFQNTDSCSTLETREDNVLNVVRSAYAIEEFARRNKLSVVYNDDGAVPTEKNSFLFSTIRLEKKEIIAASAEGKIFPPKTTRHIIPSRPLGLSIPLKWLTGMDQAKAQELFLSQLRKLRVRHLPEGAWIGSRRYQEEVFLFE